MPDIAALLRDRTLILLDFDGPICSIFAGTPAATVADALRGFAADRGLHNLTGGPTDDPLQTLRTITERRPDLAEDIDSELTRLERQAVSTATPTPGAHQFLTSAAATHTIAIASNNSPTAIQDYLTAHNLAHLIAAVAGRPRARPDRMKPNPWTLQRAMEQTGSSSAEALMIGDSPSDITAAHALAIPCIALANKPGKRERLEASGADITVCSMTKIAATSKFR